MRMLAGSRMRNQQSVEKDRPRQWGREIEEQEDQPQLMTMPFTPSAVGAGLGTQVKGVNSSIFTYNVLEVGTAGAHFWSLNLSTLPGEQRRLLTVLGASTFLVNYALDSYPSRINVILNQATPSLDETGSLSHNVAALAPNGPAIAVTNPGNIIGYNVAYGLLGAFPPVDITGLPSLTFDVSADGATTPVAYPLTTPIAIIVQITHVMF